VTQTEKAYEKESWKHKTTFDTQKNELYEISFSRPYSNNYWSLLRLRDSISLSRWKFVISLYLFCRQLCRQNLHLTSTLCIKRCLKVKESIRKMYLVILEQY